MRKKHVSAVGEQLIARHLFYAEDEIAAAQVFSWLGSRLNVFIIRKDPQGGRLEDEMNLRVLLVDFLDILGRENCSSFPYALVFSPNAHSKTLCFWFHYVILRYIIGYELAATY